ncbi:tenomodulin [Engraulis encrasicolus]|uniref:tenomodulin n=1 Tax=Engraulis encrasicolus TaxID=184585 RepID=UPI002FD07016
MESGTQSHSQQTLWKDVEEGKEKTARHRCFQVAAVSVSLVFLLLSVCIFSLWHFWNPGYGKVYDHAYTAVVDGLETDSLMEIDPVHRVEIFRMGNDTDEILEVHDFKNGITGIRFSKHQRCYIKAQTKELPKMADGELEDGPRIVGELETVEMKVEDAQVWVPSDEPITNHAFLLESKIWEVCRELPIHWIHPAPLRDAEFHDVEDVEEAPEEETHRGQRKARDILDDAGVHDYRAIGFELSNALDEQGYCCQSCRRGYRHCQRYHEPLRGYNPYPYFYQGGRVICQVIMPCNWWIARMFGRV